MIGYDGKPIPKVVRGDLRYSNIKAFKKNYAQINWGKRKKHKPKTNEATSKGL